MDEGVFDPTSSKIEILVGPDRYEEPESEDELLDVDAICAKDFDRVWREQELTCPGSLPIGPTAVPAAIGRALVIAPEHQGRDSVPSSSSNTS